MAANMEHLNADEELMAPEWLNTGFFANVLQESEKDASIRVKNVNVAPAIGKGDNLASVIYRATVQYDTKQQQDQTKWLIIKIMPQLEGYKKEMLKETHHFETEINMYNVTLPHFERLLHTAHDNTVFRPVCHYHSLSPKKVIIFDDLVPRGYTVIRNRHPNVEEVKLAYLKLATFHAAGYKLAQENPNYFEKYTHGLMSLPHMQKDFIVGGLDNFIEVLGEVPTLCAYIKYFESMRGKLIPKCKASFDEYWHNRQKNKSYVLCHGDFHFRNLMFKHEPRTQTLQDVLMLDYQLCYMGPQVMDVMHSSYMMLDRNLRAEHLDELIHHYFTSFIDTLNRIGYEGRLPKLREFKQQLAQHRHYEIFLMVTLLPIAYTLTEKAFKPEEIISSAEYRKSMYRNKLFLEELHTLLPKYLYMGCLDD